MTDIDIDFANREVVLSKITHRVAKLLNGKPHNTGVYVTEIPHNPFNEVATIDYKTAEQRGYFKLDFLNVSIYKGVKDELHLQQLMNKEPIWELLEADEFTDQLFHVSGHGNILRTLKPNSIEQLAATLAIIRPAKRHLLNTPWSNIMSQVWNIPTDGAYYFKHAHGISYAVAVAVHMNLLCEQITSEA